VPLAEPTIFQLWLPARRCGAFATGTMSALFDVAALVCVTASAPVTVVAAAAPVAGPATATTGPSSTAAAPAATATRWIRPRVAVLLPWLGG